MTETKSDRPAGSEDAPRCVWGSGTKAPCWRSASEEFFPRHEGPSLCAEHAKLAELSQEQDAWQLTLEIIEEWMRGPVAEEPSGHLENLAWKMLDEAREKYARVSATTYAAELIANHGPPKEGKPHLTSEQGEALTRLIVRADSFMNARTALEDLPKDAVRDRWVTIHALVVAAEEANEEVNRYKAGLGLKD